MQLTWMTFQQKEVTSGIRIRTILINPVYLGITIYNATTLIRDSDGKRKRVVRPKEDWIIRNNTHEPLISKEKFERIQKL